jgi:hypothetical protein
MFMLGCAIFSDVLKYLLQSTFFFMSSNFYNWQLRQDLVLYLPQIGFDYFMREIHHA